MDTKERNLIIDLLLRLVVSMVVVAVTAFFVPGMKYGGGFKTLALISIAIAVVQQILDSAFGLSRSAKGCSGFLVTALILFITGKLISGFTVSVMGALTGGLIFGAVDALIPGEKLHK